MGNAHVYNDEKLVTKPLNAVSYQLIGYMIRN